MDHKWFSYYVSFTQILASRKYVQYHQEKYGYEKPNTIFVQGYIEKLNETGIQSGSLDVLVWVKLFLPSTPLGLLSAGDLFECLTEENPTQHISNDNPSSPSPLS